MHRFTRTFLVCAVAAGAILTGCAPASASTTSNLEVIAHRGGAGEHPQESLQAVTAAGKLGVPVEFDLARLKDGGWALSHDLGLERTLVGKKGKVASLTRKQWRASCIKGPRTKCGTPITWSQAIKAVPKNVTLVPEIKDPKITPAKMDAVLKKYKVKNRTIVQTFDLKTAKALGKRGIKTLYLVWAKDAASTNWAALKKVGVQYAGVDWRTTAKNAAVPRKAGMRMWIWEVHDKSTATTWAKRGASGIFTDDPKAMKAKLK